VPRAAIALVLALTVGATPLYACDPSWLPIARTAGISYFLVVALADTVVELVAGASRSQSPSSPFDRRVDTVLGRSRGGQRVRIRAIRGPGSERMASSLPAEAVVVPWAFGPDCAPIAWTESPAWMSPGTEGMMTGWFRSREHWLEGLPTFDVEMAWREPLWQPEDSRWPRVGPAASLLSPKNFLELYGALPDLDLLERDPRRAAALARRWEREHRDLAARPPARTMLDNLYRYVAAEARHPGEGK
jgi:hypothetical protein